MVSVLVRGSRFSFPPYTQTFHGFKCTKNNHYRYHLTRLFKDYPDASWQQAKLIFNQGIQQYIEDIKRYTALEWSEKSFKSICFAIKKSIQNGNELDDIKRRGFGEAFTENNVRETPLAVATRSLGYVLENLTAEQVTSVLDQYSKQDEVEWGQAIDGMKQLKWTVIRMNKNYRYKLIQRQKQSLLCAVTILDHDGTVKNKSLIRHLGDKHFDVKLYDTLQKLRLKIDNDASLHLYDRKYDGKYRSFDFWPLEMKQAIREFWDSDTIPSPETRDQLIIEGDRDADGMKPTHAKHRLRGTIRDFSERFMTEQGKAICLRMSISKEPSYSLIYSLKPSYIRVDNTVQYDLCKKCFNFACVFKQYKKVYLSSIFG